MDIRKNIIITCVSLFVCATILANQKPYVTNLSRDKYHAANKNWSIGQDEKGIMYFGNSIGLLASDGMEWKLFQTPDASLVRAIAVESPTPFTVGAPKTWDAGIETNQEN